MRTLISIVFLAVLYSCVLIIQPYYAFVLLFIMGLTLLMYLKNDIALMLVLLFFIFYLTFVEIFKSRISYLANILNSLDELIILLLFLNMSLRKILSKQRIRFYGLGILIFCLIVLGLSGDLLHKVNMKSSILGCFIFIKGLLIFITYSNSNFKKYFMARFVGFFIKLSIFILFIGLVEIFMPVRFAQFFFSHNVDYRFGVPSVQSFFVHPGVFGWFCSFVALLFYAKYHIHSKQIDAWGCLFFLLGAVFSMRLKPIVGFILAISAGLFIIRGKIPAKRRIPFFWMLPFILMVVPIASLASHQFKSYLLSNNPMSITRDAFYILSFNLANNHFPFGLGFGQFGGVIASEFESQIYFKYFSSAQRKMFMTDTFWPVLLGEIGWVGVLLFVAIIVILIKHCRTGYSNATDNFSRVSSLFGILILIEACVESIASPVFLGPPQAYLIFASLGIILSFQSRLNDKKVCDANNKI